ncbi:MAG: glutamate racemase [Nitrospinota bacterium]|nr:glutamate racemase [Nitrospinota bacterium]
MGDNRPIGIFDSGIGGLTVLEEIHRLMPDERICYLGDTARVPYGSKSKETVLRYTLNNVRFLKEAGVKIVVVACNTASAYALPDLEGHDDPPVIGVIEGGVEAASKSLGGKIGVIGTEATIKSNVYQQNLERLRPGAQVKARACPMFVPLVEEGWTGNQIAQAVAEEYLAQFKGTIDTLVLGCTHYPLLKKVIGQVVGEEVRLVDSAQETALLVKKRLEKLNLLCDPTGQRPDIRFFVTDSPKRSMEVARRMLGNIEINEAEFVDIV